MGEHYVGDVKEICDITKPDISVVTGINESHLERMKNMDTVAATVFEIVGNAKPGATVVLNADDNRVMENYKKFVWPDNQVFEFRVSSFESRHLILKSYAGKRKLKVLGKPKLIFWENTPWRMWMRR